MCYLSVSSSEAGEKLKELYAEGIPLGDSNLPINFLRNKFWPRWTRTCFVGNLNWNAEEWHLEEFMQDCGEILSISIARTPTGQSRGFAFVEFLQRNQAMRALYKDDTEFLGRNVAVTLRKKPEFRPRVEDQ